MVQKSYKKLICQVCGKFFNYRGAKTINEETEVKSLKRKTFFRFHLL